jgi:hypothetical protein
MVCDKTDKPKEPKALKKTTLSEEVQTIKSKLDTLSEMLEVIDDIISEEYEDESEDEKEDETLSVQDMKQMEKDIGEANNSNSVLVSK